MYKKKIKQVFYPLIKSVVATEFLWKKIHFFLRFGTWLKYEKSKIDILSAQNKLNKLFADLTVKEGYFKGLRYPSFNSFGSSLFPKLSGSYESELFNFFLKIEKNNYNSIIDIGCAEGFYAAGLALKFPISKIIAFDIDTIARKLCSELCLLNEVGSRVEILGECTPELMASLNKGLRKLIICDCEGFEEKLFNSSNVGSLNKSDLLIELHPMHVVNVKEYLSSLFEHTHTIQIISSYDDNRKIFDIASQFKTLSHREKLILVQEGRAFSMDWLIALPK